MKILFITALLCLPVDQGWPEKQQENLIITGDSMELVDHGEKVIFKGGVKLERVHSMMMGDEMIYHKKTGIINIKGNVKLRLRNESDVLLARCLEAVYSEKDDTGRMWGNLEIVRTSGDEFGQVNMYAEKLAFDGQKEEWLATKNVHIVQYQTESWSDRAQFLHREEKMILSGRRPLMRRKDEESMGEYTADTITILYRDKRMILDGNVQGWIRLRKEEKEDEPAGAQELYKDRIKNLREKRDIENENSGDTDE